MNQPPYEPQNPYGMPYPPYYPQPYPPAQPPVQARKKPLWPWIVVLISLILVASCCLLASIVNPARLSVQATGTWATTHTFPGAATKTLNAFTVSGPWKLKWNCAPHTNYFGSYNLIIRVIYADGQKNLAVNTICNYNNISGEVQEDKDGTVTLDIIADGEWVIHIEELE